MRKIILLFNEEIGVAYQSCLLNNLSNEANAQAAFPVHFEYTVSVALRVAQTTGDLH